MNHFRKHITALSRTIKALCVISHSSEIAYRIINSQGTVPVINVRQLRMANQCSFGFHF